MAEGTTTHKPCVPDTQAQLWERAAFPDAGSKPGCYISAHQLLWAALLFLKRLKMTYRCRKIGPLEALKASSAHLLLGLHWSSAHPPPLLPSPPLPPPASSPPPPLLLPAAEEVPPGSDTRTEEQAGREQAPRATHPAKFAVQIHGWVGNRKRDNKA